MRVLVACEESQRVCTAFRNRGHEAYSCDILDPSGEHTEWHVKGDALKLINGNCEFATMDGTTHRVNDKWDLLIAHPPCTFLTVTGNSWFDVNKYGEKAKQRYKDRYESIVFFMYFALADCDRIAIENPVGIMNTAYKKPDQIIQPYMFGDPYEKKTCIWIKGLPKLVPTNEVRPPQRKKFKSGKTMPAWYADAWQLPKGERAKARSKTFPGIAKAMAEQWGGEA